MSWGGGTAQTTDDGGGEGSLGTIECGWREARGGEEGPTPSLTGHRVMLMLRYTNTPQVAFRRH